MRFKVSNPGEHIYSRYLKIFITYYWFFHNFYRLSSYDLVYALSLLGGLLGAFGFEERLIQRPQIINLEKINIECYSRV